MANQPYYNKATILFTATYELTREQVTKMLLKIDKFPGVFTDTLECEEVSAEPGDPADL